MLEDHLFSASLTHLSRRQFNLDKSIRLQFSQNFQLRYTPPSNLSMLSKRSLVVGNALLGIFA